jgi:hypothetical protein
MGATATRVCSSLGMRKTQIALASASRSSAASTFPSSSELSRPVMLTDQSGIRGWIMLPTIACVNCPALSRNTRRQTHRADPDNRYYELKLENEHCGANLADIMRPRSSNVGIGLSAARPCRPDQRTPRRPPDRPAITHKRPVVRPAREENSKERKRSGRISLHDTKNKSDQTHHPPNPPVIGRA